MSHVSWVTRPNLGQTKLSFCTIGRGHDIILLIQSLRHPALSLRWLLKKKKKEGKEDVSLFVDNKGLFLR